MKSFLSVRHPLLVLPAIAVLGVWLAGCEPSSGETGPAAQGPAPVTVSTPIVKSIVEWDEYTGRFEAVETVEIRARVSGYLDSIHFEDGQIVDKGDLLFVIDPRPFEAALDGAQAELEQAKARQELAALELKRGQRLVGTGAISREVFDERRQSKRETDAAVAAAEAALRSAELDLSFTQILAPVAGRVSDDFVSVGNLVNGGSANSTVLTTIVTLDPIHFVFDASEAQHLKYVRLGQSGQRPSSREAANPVYVKLVDETEFGHEGKMNFVDNRLDPNTGTIRGRAIFDNPDLLLAPGMFGRLRLMGSGEYEAVMLPDTAVLTDQSRRFVWLVNDENMVEYRPVQLGPVVDGLRVIRDGLGGNDRVIIGGIQRVRPGAIVAPEVEQLVASN